MKKIKLLALLLTSIVLSACGGEKVQEVIIEPNGNQLTFKQTEIRVKAGQKVKLIMKNTATIPMFKHNVAILKNTNSIEEVGKASATEVDGIAEENPNILFYTPQADPGTQTEVVFTAPEPGKYPYICSAMGHYVTMQGVLIVE